MRKHIYLAGLASLALMVSGVATAQGAVVSQTMNGKAWPIKQFKKKRPGGVNLFIAVNAAYDQYQPAPAHPSSHVRQVILHFDNDFVFNTGRVPRCSVAQLENTTTAQALAACGSARLGAGSAQTNGVLGPVPATVTAFNGQPTPSGNQILLHARVGPPINSTTVIRGVLGPSSRGGDFARQIDFAVDPLGGGYQVITNFNTTINKRVSVKAKRIVKRIKRKGKVRKKVIKKPPKFFVSAFCRDKNRTWDYAGSFDFVDNPGGGVENVTLNATSQQGCKVKPVKKKKKKKKRRR